MGRATPPPVEPRPEIAASWARSLRSGVTGDALAPSLAADADPTGRLASLAAPVLDRLSSTLADTRTTVVLTDAHAGVLDRRAGTQPLGDLLDGIGLVPGYSYAEDVVGTNGMGTAAEERRAVLVKGPEHYAEALRPLTCMGVPIEHPVTGRLEGVLDLTCFNEDAGPWMAPLVAEAVAGIRGQLRGRRHGGRAGAVQRLPAGVAPGLGSGGVVEPLVRPDQPRRRPAARRRRPRRAVGDRRRCGDRAQRRRAGAPAGQRVARPRPVRGRGGGGSGPSGPSCAWPRRWRRRRRAPSAPGRAPHRGAPPRHHPPGPLRTDRQGSPPASPTRWPARWPPASGSCSVGRAAPAS
ncbi:GAF domain-containing protein [Aquihabitans sp. G128]|uniref:GAF domain-containing protein n=1 Tax=Aquihabitans sp. G128 TaxID=2849779 RepID=UPI001C22721C|nr:GAF domain-containing protein [Aquihabitans sp. G128]